MADDTTGRALDVDLTTGRITDLEVSPEDRRLYLGGKGLATRLLYDLTEPGVDPFDPRMVLIFAVGPVTGSLAPQSNRFVVTTRSPLTGGVGSSTCGGNFATKLKRAGVDLVVVRGRAEHPVTIEITEEGVHIRDARHLWGLDTQATQAALPKGYGMAVIGPAGENLVRFASVVSQERIAGRTGTGAVMGSKNLKAIVANGKRKLPMDDPDAFETLRKATTGMLREHAMTGKVLPELGTANIVRAAAGRNILPVRNWQAGSDPGAVQISGETLAERYLRRRVGCTSCPIVCGRGIALHDAVPGVEPQEKPEIVKGPEYETLGLLGSNLGCFDLARIFEWNKLADDLGMDTISLGGVLGFATELTQRGMLESPLSFDDHSAVSGLIADIAHRRGLGQELAEGVRRMALKYGGSDFAVHVKGLELPAYDPRGSYGQGLEYATTNRGGCHVQGATMFMESIGPLGLGPHDTRVKPQLVFMQQNLAAAVTSSVFCLFSTYAILPSLIWSLDPQGWAHRLIRGVMLNSGPVFSMVVKSKAPVPVFWYEKFLTHVTGRRTTMGDFMEVGERVFNLERLYNLREGVDPSDDTLPRRMLEESTFPGIEGGVPLDRMLPRYYKLRGWSPEGVPTQKTVARLQIRT